jgi:hypothetical protein
MTGTLDTVLYATSSFYVIVASACNGQTITASTNTDSAYSVNNAALVKSLTAFTISSGTCTTITYTLTTDTGAAIDSSVFTFSTSPL